MRAKFSPGEILSGLLFALGARFGAALFFMSQRRPASASTPWQNTLATVVADTPSYVEPIDHFLAFGSYHPDWRPPGYGIPYLLGRLFLDPADAASAVVILQILCSAVAVLALAGIAAELEPDRRFAMAVFFTFALAISTAQYDIVLATESFAVSTSVFLVWVMLRLRQSGSSGYVFAAGVLASWLVFLRPVLGAVVVTMGVWLNAFSRTRLKLSVAFLFPLIAVSGAWGLRGLYLHDRFEPLGARWAPYYSPADRALHGFVQSFGGSIVHWNPKAEIVWFEFLTSRDFQISKEAIASIAFPADIYTTQVTPESLLAIKVRLKNSLREGMEPEARALEQASIAKVLESMAESIRDERPFVYYFKAPLRVLWGHLAHPGTVGLLPLPWRELPWPLLVVKLSMSALYVWVVCCGLAGVVLLLFGQRADRWAWSLVAGAFLVPILVHTLVLRLDEYRYFAPSFPFGLVFACAATRQIWCKGSQLGKVLMARSTRHAPEV